MGVQFASLALHPQLIQTKEKIMAKSIHFNQVPNMRGKLTMPFTDVVAMNFKPKIIKKIHENEMLNWHENETNENYSLYDKE